MRVELTKSFEKDIPKIDNSKIAEIVINIIEDLRISTSISGLQNIKKMKDSNNAYRIKIKDFRLGIYIEGDKVIISRLLHRKDIYKYFPK